MVEFSENFSERFTGKKAIQQRVFYRIAVRKGEIPYFSGGLDAEEFTLNEGLLASLRNLLSDIDVNVNVVQDRVTVGDIEVLIPWLGV
jgi:hypothetical protein